MITSIVNNLVQKLLKWFNFEFLLLLGREGWIWGHLGKLERFELQSQSLMKGLKLIVSLFCLQKDLRIDFTRIYINFYDVELR